VKQKNSLLRQGVVGQAGRAELRIQQKNIRLKSQRLPLLIAHYLLLTTIHLGFGANIPEPLSHTITRINDLTQEITIAFNVAENDCIYKDFITISSYEPTVNICAWKANKLPVAHYDPSFKDTKLIFNENFTISTIANAHHTSTEPAYLYCSYYRRSEKKINHTLIPLFFTTHTELDDKNSNEIIADNSTHTQSTSLHISPINDYYYQILSMLRMIVESFKTDHKKYFLLYILLISLLLLLSHFFKEQLNKQRAVKELNDVIILLLGSLITLYTIFYIHIISTPFIVLCFACSCSLIIGVLYTKKSTQLQSGYLRTLCTLIGGACISGAIFLLFKTLQFL